MCGCLLVQVRIAPAVLQALRPQLVSLMVDYVELVQRSYRSAAVGERLQRPQGLRKVGWMNRPAVALRPGRQCCHVGASWHVL